jgi:drug/metabolite transporter (DMT)-like permease
MYPVFVVLIMCIVFRERLLWSTIVSVFLAFAGVIVLNINPEGIAFNGIGLTVVLLSALFYALYIIIIQKFCANMPSSVLTFYALGFGSLFFLAECLLQGDSLAIPSLFIGIELIIFALVTTIISSITLALAIQYIGPTKTSILGALEPVVAVVVSVMFLHELLTLTLIIGIILIITAVVLLIIYNDKTKAPLSGKSPG